jgi:hypothetical protein
MECRGCLSSKGEGAGRPVKFKVESTANSEGQRADVVAAWNDWLASQD